MAVVMVDKDEVVLVVQAAIPEMVAQVHQAYAQPQFQAPVVEVVVVMYTIGLVMAGKKVAVVEVALDY